MVAIPTLLLVWLVWFPAVGVGAALLHELGRDRRRQLGKFIGLKNYSDVVTIYPPFWPAVQHNLIWLAVLFLVATPLGIFFAVLLDREIRGLAGSTRRRSTCRWCCRSPWSASSGS